jgi:outer membrane receptor protein involved in Fe transport
VGEIPGIGKILNQTDPYDSESFVQEIRFVSETGDQFSWVAGALYSNVENGGRFAFVVDGLQDFVAAVAAPGIITSDDFFAGPAEMESSETAVYADMTWQFNEAWRFSAGVRAFSFESDFEDLGQYVFDFASFGPLELPGFVNKADDNDMTWRAVLAYQPDDTQHYYFNISRGYRVGQVNPNFGPSFVDPADVVIPASYDPDESINYEIGLKNRLLDDRLQLNLAAYYVDWTDVQVDALRPSDERNYIANAGDVIAKGIELEAALLVTDSLDLRLTAGWQSSEVDSVSAANSLLSGAVKGDTMPGTPDFVGSVQANYFGSIRNDLELQAYLSIQYVDESPNRFSRQAATGLPHPDFAINEAYVNVDAGVGIGRDQWMLTAYAENLLNNDDIILDTGAVATASGENHYIRLKPRTVGVRLEYQF